MPDKQQLIETEPDALFRHWRRMAMLTLQNEPVDLDKLRYCVLRLEYWQERMSERDGFKKPKGCLKTVEVD